MPTVIQKECKKTARYVWFYQPHVGDWDVKVPALKICEVQIFGKFSEFVLLKFLFVVVFNGYVIKFPVRNVLVFFKVVRQEHTMSTVLKHAIIVRITKLVTLIPGNVMIMGVRFLGVNHLCVVVSYLNQVIYWVCNN